MKNALSKWLLGTFVLAGFMISLTACKKKDDPILLPQISSFSPESGSEGTTVIITGDHFGNATSSVQVSFNDVTAAISNATTTSLTVTVPTGATTGKIVVTVNGFMTTSATDFIVKQTPTITSFSPTSGIPSSVVTIIGTNFSTTLADNLVMFNGVSATVTSATSTQLTVTVPSTASTGKITVSVNSLLSTSTADFVVTHTPTLTAFSPTSAGAGSSITLTGTNFSSTLNVNVVKFNGVTATVTAATATQLMVTVPPNASTGKITVTIVGLTGTSATDFILLPTPSITSLSPAYGKTGTTVVITGTNFSGTNGDNTVKFNGTTAVVSAASSTQLTVTIPGGATSGKISITVNGVTGTSVADFLIGCPDAIISSMAISNIVGNNFTVTYNIKNTGAVPMTLSSMFIQAYVSTDGTLESQAAGGFGDYGSSEPLLQPNEVRQKTQDITPGVSIATYPYVIFTLISSSPGPSPECSTSNNTAYKLIQ